MLITGETGTGKELVARALHFEGVRGDAPFVELNCSTIPGDLLEAELFGYERGAFTDAKQRKLGLIEAAAGGTLFLDEIGDIDPRVQVKLLKLLEDKTVRRLGSVREQRANIRIVTATNRDLEQAVREGSFPRRPAVPAAHRALRPAAAARARRRCARCSPSTISTCSARATASRSSRFSAEAERAMLRYTLAGQRARTAQRDRAGGHHGERRDRSTPPTCA